MAWRRLVRAGRRHKRYRHLHHGSTAGSRALCQAFRSRHTRLSCAGAPIFDPQGGLLGVLDVSKVHQQSDDQQFPLLLQTVVVSARAIEERIFREHFQYCWILAAAPSDDFGSSLLLAIDDHQSIIGGDQAARKLFALSDESLTEGILLSAAFAFDH